MTMRGEGDSVSLTVPGRSEYLRLVRLAAADSGARADLSIEEVEDLRIAVDELAYALIGDDHVDATLSLQYVVSPGVVEVEGSCLGPGGEAAVSELSRSIIKAVADDYEISTDGDVRQFRLVKRSRRE